MILKEEHFKLAISSNGGFSSKQVLLLGITPDLMVKGWKHTILGKDFPQEAIENFIDLKDMHLKNKQPKNIGQISIFDTATIK